VQSQCLACPYIVATNLKEGINPYNGTVSFDNIAQSMELVFVIMSSNTFTDLMFVLVRMMADFRYYAIDAEHEVASLCTSQLE
jgi:hypothetical protein